MTTQLKVAKDALVSSLFELSKAANDASAATVNFYNASLNSDDDSTRIFGELADSLKLLTRAAEGVSSTAHTIAGEEVMLPVIGDVPQLPTSVIPTDVIETPAAGPAKKKKVEKDPYAPKKPLTVFFAYSSYIREAIRNERSENNLPPFSSTEITQEISRRWNELSNEEKEKWKVAYGKELLSYQEIKEKYIEDKKNGLSQTVSVTSAPVPLPPHLLTIQEDKVSKKRSSDGLSKEEKKKKKKEKKEKRKSLAVDGSLIV